MNFLKVIAMSFILMIMLGLNINDMSSQNRQLNNRDFVPDKKTAIAVAEAIWLPIYGKSIYKKTPFIAKLEGDTIWVVSGSLPKGTLGGVPAIYIRKKDCKVLKVWHGK